MGNLYLFNYTLFGALSSIMSACYLIIKKKDFSENMQKEKKISNKFFKNRFTFNIFPFYYHLYYYSSRWYGKSLQGGELCTAALNSWTSSVIRDRVYGRIFWTITEKDCPSAASFVVIADHLQSLIFNEVKN